MNNIISKLDENIKSTWEQVRMAAKAGHEDITAAQTALGRVSHLVNLKNQQLTLEKSIAASIAGDTAPAPVPDILDQILSNLGRGKRQTVRPTEIRFGTFKKQIRYSNEIPLTVANWLLEQGKVLPTIRNFIHPSDTGFAKSAKTKRLVSGQFMEIGMDQKYCIESARELFNVCGYRTMKFEVLFEDGNTVTA